ncbi:P2R1A-PPP2R2A-interacting phosphatase regulator 1 isoform X1 [Euwallacea similis]|uniref:P2R1A-PPP2R2A-interacting phosphatase regulator 1 isoform X1 n=1 Tax=Euwallacea similis TaxID=1736056 RepID=UPI0034510F79
MSSSNSAMDVDGAPGSAPGPLKRCSSAPMINEASSSTMSAVNSSSSTPCSHASFTNLFGFANPTRNRRHSASFSQMPGSPVSGLRRIHQLRQEEHEVTSNSRELAHEKEIHNAMQISQSWEDISLMNESPSDSKANRMGPIHVTLPPASFICNSPSPTRGYGFQSPTRRSFTRRSESPVSLLRPSPLGGAKRKLDERDVDFSVSPRPKRAYSYSMSDTRGLLSTTTNSLPGSLSSAGTPESLSSADSPGSGFAFRGVDSPSPTLQGSNQGEPMMVGKGDHDMAESPS